MDTSSDLYRYAFELKKARKRNGDLMNVILESAPHRVDDNGNIIPLEAVERSSSTEPGMRASKEPCIGCGKDWVEPSRRGKMNKKCPDCRAEPDE